MLELYHFHGATCGLKARLSLAEKGVEYTGHAVERAYLRSPEYLKLNANGVVPTLIHDGEVLVESSVIINYVDDAFDGPPLKPAGPMGAAKTWWWMKRADECLPMIGTL
ncbi:MAG: glutathione S-transferase family protein, partial [Rhodospirillales bacterium]|nr:glutathione S-transferase family protein [Rhodospirillales bacterium]